MSETTDTPMPRILVAEDETPMRTVLRDTLERHGYRVILARDGEEGLERAIQEKPDLVILDIMMPRLSGIEVCTELRRLEHKEPIIMLTAKGSVEDRIQGLDAGADDYLPKPFSRDELLARIRAQLRKVERGTSAPESLRLGDVEIDFTHQKVLRDGENVAMTAKEFAMLKLLASRPNEPITREQFLDLVWGYTSFPTTRTVDKHVVSLRQKIEPNPDQPTYIKTIHAVGYKLELD